MHSASAYESGGTDSEEHLRLALATSGLGAWKLDLATLALDCSDVCKACFGLPPGEPMTLASVRRALHPEDCQELRTALTRAITRRSDFRARPRCRWPDGSVHQLVGRGRVVLDADRRPVRIVGVVRDVTTRERGAAHRRPPRDGGPSEQTDLVIARVSHELRSPLLAVLLWAGTLRAGSLTEEEVRRAAARIEQSAHRLTRMVGDLHDRSRLAAGKLDLELGPVDAVSVLETVLEVVRPMAEQKGVRLEALLDPALSLVADETRLSQVFWNLLSNAVKFTPAGGCVHVSLRRCGGHAEVRVTDTGEGIDSEFLPHLFEAFQQARRPGTTSTTGLGLGLAIVRQLVELHGGRVWAESDGEGSGATFVAVLPLAREAERPTVGR